jgi:hypothetical protein
MGDVDEFNARALIDAGRELLETVQVPRRTLSARVTRLANPAQVPMVYGVSMHTLRLGSAALDLDESGKVLEAMPLVRAVFEHALTAQWLAHSAEAQAAFVNEGIRHRKNIAATMLKVPSEVFTEGVESVAHKDDEYHETSIRRAFPFEDLCNGLRPGGPQAYLLYRILSSLVHSGPDLSDRYLILAEDHASGVRFRDEPEQPEDTLWLHLLIASMMWGAKALDSLEQDHPHRSYLATVARRLRVAKELKLTPEAIQRERQAQKERRQKAWKGKRPRGKPQAPR